jgi:hypothetical protein
MLFATGHTACYLSNTPNAAAGVQLLQVTQPAPHLLVYAREVILVTVCGADDLDSHHLAAAAVKRLVHTAIRATPCKQQQRQKQQRFERIVAPHIAACRL